MELRAVAEKLEYSAKQSGLVGAGADPLLAEVEAAFARVKTELLKIAG